MCYKLDQSLFVVLVAIMLVAPPVQALNDDVAVQLLERLNDLEGEVNALRSENESLKDKLDGALTREDDENQVKAEAASASTDDSMHVENQAKSVDAASAEPQIPGVNIIVEDTEQANANAVDTTEIPSLEQEVASSEVAMPTASKDAATHSTLEAASVAPTDLPTTNPVDSTPALLNVGTAAVTTESRAATPTEAAASAPAAVTNAPVTASDSTNQASLQAPATAATSEPAQATPAVDPKSKDSYYYYGTAEEQKKTEIKPVAAAVPAATTPTADNLDQNRKAKADYNQAYQLLVNKPAEAVPLFRNFLANYPQHELAANAQYWLAEALYAQKDFAGASQEFMKVLKQYKDSPKSSGAALKLGYSFYELQQWEYARRTLEDTVRFFPDTSSAKLAEVRLQKMKSEGH